MKSSKLIHLFTLSFLILGASRSGLAQDEEKMFNQEIKYACTGIAESKEDPRWNNYPLKLMFTTGGRAYVSYVEVKIQDSTGKQIFEANCDAPWLLVDLKPGKYQVTAVALQQHRKQATVLVTPNKQNAVAIRFPEISGDR